MHQRSTFSALVKESANPNYPVGHVIPILLRHDDEFDPQIECYDIVEKCLDNDLIVEVEYLETISIH